MPMSSLLDFSSLEMVHVDMDAICSHQLRSSTGNDLESLPSPSAPRDETILLGFRNTVDMSEEWREDKEAVMSLVAWEK